MGRMAAEDMVAQTDTRTALAWHLQSNHYPPVPLSMVEPSLRAIKQANKGNWNARVRLPAGVLYKGMKTAPVRAMIEQHHLDVFLNPVEEE